MQCCKKKILKKLQKVNQPARQARVDMFICLFLRESKFFHDMKYRTKRKLLAVTVLQIAIFVVAHHSYYR